MADKNPIFYNRELSWLEFDKRCLSEAKDRTIPLFERIKFLSITASNLDEFFMVRIASLTDMVHAGYTKKDIAGMTAREQLDALHASTKEFMKNQYLKDILYLLLKLRILYRERYLNSLVQISRHPVRTSHVYILKSVIIEIEYSRVLKIISNYGSY